MKRIILILILSLIFMQLTYSDFSERYYYNLAFNGGIENGIKYLDKFPVGKYQEKILNKNYYLLKSEEIEGENIRTIYSYNPKGRLVEKYTYNDLEWLGISKIDYDLRGNLSEILSLAKGDTYKKITLKYDSKNNLIEERIKVSNRSDTILTNELDSDGNIVKMIYTRTPLPLEDSSTLVKGTSVFTYKSDDRGNFLESFGTTVVEQGTKSDFNNKKVAESSSWERISYKYDKNFNLTEIHKEGSNGFWTRYSWLYNGEGAVIEGSFTDSNGRKTTSYFLYDLNGFVKKVKTQFADREWKETTYEYGDSEDGLSIREEDRNGRVIIKSLILRRLKDTYEN